MGQRLVGAADGETLISELYAGLDLSKELTHVCVVDGGEFR